MTASEQADWIAALYQGRNAAAHEGWNFARDMDVDYLGELAFISTRHAAWHLAPQHRPSHRTCRTYEAAMRCAYWG
jgi:hypothetical protein